MEQKMLLRRVCHYYAYFKMDHPRPLVFFNFVLSKQILQ